MENPMFTAPHCQHGECVGHTPQVQVLRVDIVPTHFLGLRVNVFYRCCGRFMAIVKKVEQIVCRSCGAQQTRHIAGFVQCRCCGRLDDVRGY
jgi:hypothetical protein